MKTEDIIRLVGRNGTYASGSSTVSNNSVSLIQGSVVIMKGITFSYIDSILHLKNTYKSRLEMQVIDDILHSVIVDGHRISIRVNRDEYVKVGSIKLD